MEVDSTVASMHSTRRVFLRLDDGSLITNAKFVAGAEGEGAIRVPCAKAIEMGKTPRDQVDRFMDMVMTMQEIAAMRRHSKLDLMAPIPPQQTAPQAPPARAGDTIATGRQPRAAAVAATVAVANGLAEQALSDSVGDGDAWKKTCATILDALYAHLEKDNMKGVFDRPVDTVAIPNYLNVIKNPMDLGTVEQRLKQLAMPCYTGPQMFYEDVMQVWANAKLFNRKETIYHQTAARMSALFERMWRDCGLQQAIARSRRANAGVPGRQAYEVALESPQPSARQPRSKSEGKKRRRDDDASAGSVRLASQARTGGTPARRAMSTDEIMAVAEGLQRAFAMETGADHVKAELMAVLQRANAIQEDEVDFEALDNSSLWDLKAILERL